MELQFQSIPLVAAALALSSPVVWCVPGVTTHSFRKTVATLIDEEGLSVRICVIDTLECPR